jgi:MFS family permease
MSPNRNQALPIYIAAGCIFAALAVRSFALPLRVVELGGDRVAIGLLFSISTVAAAGLSLPAGFLGDRFGKRTLLLLSIAVGGLSQLGMGVAGSVPPLFVWQVLAGIGLAGAQAALMAALVDMVPSARVGRAVGWLTLAIQVGLLIGPALAGTSLHWMRLGTALAVSSGLFALALAMTLAIPGTSGRVVGWNIVAPLREIASSRAFLVATVAMLAATTFSGTMQAYLPIFGTQQLGLTAQQAGYLIAIQAVASALARIPGGRIVDRMPRRVPWVASGLAAYGAAVAILPHVTGFWAATILLVVSGPILAIVFIALGVLFSNLSTAETRGVAMGVYGMVLFLGLGLGPAVFGTVMEHGGYLAGFTACAATGLLMAALTIALHSDRLGRWRPAPA